MNLLDRIALAGRRYERRHSTVDGGIQIGLDELLRILHGKTILEIATKGVDGKDRRAEHQTSRPVSLLDFLAEADGGYIGTYEVFQTPPSGDYSRMRILCRPSGGEIAVLMGPRQLEPSMAEDPLIQVLAERSNQT